MVWNTGFQVWLTESQSMANAQMIVNDLYIEGKDWTKESLSAMIGNMRHESSVNPNMYEYGYDWSADRGYGLVQWTPRSKFWDWALGAGLDPEKPESQLARIDYETKNNIQWIPRSSYESMTFTQFRTNSGAWSVNYLTEAFTWGYERPLESAGWDSMPERKSFANKVFNELDWTKGGTTPVDPVDPVDPEEPVDPEPEIPEYDLEGIKNLFNAFYADLKESIGKMLVADLFNYGTKNTFGNSYLKVNKQLENMYKVKPTLNFNNKMDDIAEIMLDKLGGLLIPIIPEEPEEPTDPTDPEPNTKMFFPVDFTAQGINFWTPPDQPNMDYGGARTGRLHWAYDIGTLGNENVSCHAVRSGEVLSVNADGLGTVVIKHDSDSYYTQYMHLKLGAFTVNTGDTVVAGQKIGIVGGTGGYEIHLHFAVSINGTFATQEDTISPREYLKVTGNNVTGLPNPVA